MSLGIGIELHDKAYMEVLLHLLESKEGKEAVFCKLNTLILHGWLSVFAILKCYHGPMEVERLFIVM